MKTHIEKAMDELKESIDKVARESRIEQLRQQQRIDDYSDLLLEISIILNRTEAANIKIEAIMYKVMKFQSI